MSESSEKIITLEPGKRSGKPTIRGMRITVYDALSYLAAGMTHQQILGDFPYLTGDDIRACLSYAAQRERGTLVQTLTPRSQPPIRRCAWGGRGSAGPSRGW